MITKLVIKNFKKFDDVVIPLGSPVIFVGPNNSGKTTALQALALWDLGLRTWLEKRESSVAKKRAGVKLSRRDLVQLPVPSTALLWRDLHLRQTPDGGEKATQNVLIEITVEGVTDGGQWTCPLEFDYSSDEIIHCRPARLTPDGSERANIPMEAGKVLVAYLPPMSGLASNERRIDEGAINVSLGEGQTAQVLRNLCWQLWEQEKAKPDLGEWGTLVKQLERLFGASINEPEYVAARGEILMSYREVLATARRKTDLDLSASGRGLQQTLLLLAFLRWKPGCVLLIDEPDAHLEILRQRQIYAELCETARRLGSQLLLATHSEIVLNEAEKDQIVAFVGKPHAMRHTDQVRKALALLGYEEFLKAEISGWVLYLEGTTDLETLRLLATKLGHRAAKALERPFVCYVLNQTNKAQAHFYGLREAYPNLKGIAVFDNSPDVVLNPQSLLTQRKWTRRELENYFCQPEILLRWVDRDKLSADLFGLADLERRRKAMREAITENTIPVALNDPSHKFWQSNKVSDDYLPAVYGTFFKKLGLPNSMNKSDYSQLAALLGPAEVDREIVEAMDCIADVAESVSL